MIPLLILIVLTLLLLTIAYIAFYLTFLRLPIKPNPSKSPFLAPHAADIEAGAQWVHSQTLERVSISSHDGLDLVGYFLPAENAKGTLLLVHGYRGSPWVDFSVVYEYYHSLGWNLLTVMQRASGESGGTYITFGVKERYDVRDWAVYLADRFGPTHKIVLDGISMGATCVLLSLETGLPANVRGIIADCGYTTPWDEFRHVLKSRHIPPQPIMAIVSLYAKLFAGFGFRDCSTISAVKQSNIPILFVHGEKDNFVPLRFSLENHAACAGEKYLFTVPEAGHGGSYLVDREGCRAALVAFLNRITN